MINCERFRVKRHNMTIDELIAEGERVYSRKAEGMIGEYVPGSPAIIYII